MDSKKRYLTPILLIYGVVSVTSLMLITSVAVIFLVLPFGLKTRRSVIRRMARFWFLIMGVRLNVHGWEHINHDPAVVVANHASYLDGVILQAVLPPRFGFVIKREVTKVPLVHFLLRRIGSEFAERRNRYRGGQDARRIVELAKNGNSIAVFPEGTFTSQPGLAPFRPVAFAAAVAGSLPVVPVVIEGSRAMLSADQYLPRPGRINITILPPLHVEREGRAAMQDMARRSRSAILDVLNEPDLTPSKLPNQDQRQNDQGSKTERSE